MEKYRQVSYLILSTGIIFGILSFLMFNGVIISSKMVCGSYCEVWPGIRVKEYCILSCAPRDKYYRVFFIISLILIVSSLVLYGVESRKTKLLSIKEKRRGDKKEGDLSWIINTKIKLFKLN
ncbi:MAG: hypothetical protein ACTSU2_01080 [Promethearchaeota archaeon]